MTDDGTGRTGRLDDEAEQDEASDTEEGAAARGDYDPAQGSPGQEAEPGPAGDES